MANEIATLGFDPAKLAVSLKTAAKAAAPLVAFLGMDKGGTWTFGVNGDEVEDEDEFLVHPGGFVHGWVSWADTDLPGVSAAKLGEVMVGVDKAMPAEPDEQPPKSKPWAPQMGMSLVAAADGTKLVYSTTSVGGKRAVAAIATAIAEKLVAGDVKCVPVITLGSESYKHAKWGKVTNPVFTVARWVPMPAIDATAEQAAGKPKALAAPAKKPAAKKAAAKAK